MYTGPFMSTTNRRLALPGSSRMELTLASMPSTCPVPSSLPVIGSEAKSLTSTAIVSGKAPYTPDDTARMSASGNRRLKFT